MDQSRIIASSPDGELLDSTQLELLERSYQDWAAQASGRRGWPSRCRILLLFLLIRYTGAKLSEVLALDPGRDVDLSQRIIRFCGAGGEAPPREAQISADLARQMETLLPVARDGAGKYFAVDPGFVRRKFYERAQSCGFDKKRGGPEMIRKARAVELLRHNMPLPAVQRLLGHSSPNLTSAYVSFSDEDMRALTRLYMERESGRRTSARNSFFGKISRLERGEVQTLVELSTPDGGTIRTMVTNTSAERLALRPGSLVTAEVKAPWLLLERCDRPGRSSAENSREGSIARIRAGRINTECAVRLADGTELCAILSSPGFAQLGLQQGDAVRVLFSAYAVILQAGG